MSLPIVGNMAPLESQVGGHAGVLTTEDGSLVIKPSLPSEVAFYALLKGNEALAPLYQFAPKFMGTIKATGVVKGSAADTSVVHEEIAAGKESIVLKNVSSGFKKPNILDIKLGTVLYGDDADEAKRERMIKTAKNTTSFETGIRLTGFQVYNSAEKTVVQTPKSYGKSIKPAQLPEGMAKFFPATSMSDPALLAAVIKGIMRGVVEIKRILEGIEMRMAGGSLLIIWEGDEDALRQCIAQPADTLQAAARDEEDGDPDSEDMDEDDAPKAYAVKLIDFAHARLAPGEGPDAGVLLGLETTVNLLKGRAEELEMAA